MKLKTLTEKDYESAVARNPYFKNRWHYFKEVIRIATEVDPGKVLEIGAAGLPMFPGCTTLDISPKYNPTVIQDATKVPWPFKNKEFDLVISLQTWEHLKGSQKAAFREVMRVGKTAILSFPYKWKTKNPSNCHHGLNESTFDAWTSHLNHEQLIVGEVHRRIIHTFRSL